MKSMEYEFPGQGFENNRDQFMLGSAVLVAPMLEKGRSFRNVSLPSGKWKTPEGKYLKGGKTYEFPVALDQLLYFEKQ